MPTTVAPGGMSFVNLTASDALKFSPSTISVTSLTVTFHVQNLGSTDHTFTVSSRVNSPAPSSANSSSSSGSWFAWPNLYADALLNHSSTITITINFAQAGSYQFICRYHYPAMMGTVTVGAPVASGGGLSSTSTYLLIGTVVVVVVVVLAVILRPRRPRSNGPAQTTLDPAR